jgi:outer membrane protein
MKNVERILVLASAALLLISPKVFSKELKVGVVDIQKIYAAYDKAKKSLADLQAEKDKKQEEYNKKAAELRKLNDEYNANKDKMKDAQKKELLAKIRDAKRDLDSFKKQSDEYLVAKNQDMTRERLQEVIEAAKAYAAENGFDIVVGANTMIYFAQPLDISDAVIKKINGK